jgi:alpha-glucosidase
MLLPSLLACSLSVLLQPARAAAPDTVRLFSPDGRLEVSFQVDETQGAGFDVRYRGIPVAAGWLGLEFAGSGLLQGQMKVVETHRTSRDETYAIPVGKASSARDRHNELSVSLEERVPPHRTLDLAFRAFDEGIAFRYSIPEQEPLASFMLTDEHTQLAFPDDPLARVLPLDGYTTSYEAYYESQPLSAVEPNRLLALPLLLERAGNGASRLWLAVTEANLTDYAGAYLSRMDEEPGRFAIRLSPLPGREDGAKVLGEAPHASPWRVLMVSDNPGRLLESHLVFHLNDPPAIDDVSWIQPGKTTFPWWNGYVLEGVDFEPGVNTATMKYYIDFCAERRIPYHSLDGLDIAWYGGPILPDGPTDVTKAAPSIDLPEVLRYAKQKGVRLRLWMHWKALQPQIDEAFQTFEEWGIEGVMVDFMDRDDQEMVRFYHEMAAKAARHHLTLTLHGAYKPTGMERTWPNVLTYEGVLNQEYNKWGDRGTPPEHNLDAAFIRMLAGPLDYHQGGMRSVWPEDYRPVDKAPPVQGTRGHQLAMYVVFQNHLPMLADSPAAYRDRPELEFLVEVPVTWDETRVVHAEVSHSLVMARRKGEVWYLGGMAARGGYTADVRLEFLAAGLYQATLYSDHTSAGPNAVMHREQRVSAGDTLRVVIAEAGGFIARLAPIEP